MLTDDDTRRAYNDGYEAAAAKYIAALAATRKERDEAQRLLAEARAEIAAVKADFWRVEGERDAAIRETAEAMQARRLSDPGERTRERDEMRTVVIGIASALKVDCSTCDVGVREGWRLLGDRVFCEVQRLAEARARPVLTEEPIVMLATREGEWWVAQCAQFNLATQAKTLDALRPECARIVAAHFAFCREHGVDPYANPPAPAPSHQICEGARWRPEVAAFADAMEAQLRANDHKGGWQGDDEGALIERLREETEELSDATIGHANSTNTAAEVADGRSQILREAADVANFAMMVADVCGALPSTPPAPRAVTMGEAWDAAAREAPEVDRVTRKIFVEYIMNKHAVEWMNHLREELGLRSLDRDDFKAERRSWGEVIDDVAEEPAP